VGWGEGSGVEGVDDPAVVVEGGELVPFTPEEQLEILLVRKGCNLLRDIWSYCICMGICLGKECAVDLTHAVLHIHKER
jgi:hypothetical protein